MLIRADIARRHLTHPVVLFLVVGLGYAVGSQLSWSWFGANGTFASFYPASGVVFATLLLTRRRLWPVALAAGATAETVVDMVYGLDLLPSLGYAVANTAQALVGAVVVGLAVRRPDLRRLRDLAVVLAAVGVMCGAGGALGATTYTWLDGGSGWRDFMGEWWVGDALGNVVVAGVVLSLARATPDDGIRGFRAAVSTGLLLATVTGAVFVFWFDFVPALFVAIAGIFALAFVSGTVGVAVAGAAVALLAAEATARGHGFWSHVDASPDTLRVYLQAGLVILVAGSLAVAAALREREGAITGRVLASEALRRSRGEARASLRSRLLAERVAAAATPRAVCHAMLEELMDLTRARSGVVATVSESGASLVTLAAAAGGQASPRLAPVPVGDRRHILAACLTTGPITVATRAELHRRFPLTARDRDGDCAAAVALPIPGFGGPIGAVELTFGDEQEPVREEMALLSTMVSVCGQALQRARVFEAEQRSRRNAEVLQRSAARLAAASTAAEVGRVALRDAAELGLPSGRVVARDGDGHRDLAASAPALPQEAAEDALDSAMATNGTVIARLDGAGGPVGAASEVMVVPLRGGDGTVIGALSAATPDPEGIGPAARRLLTAVAEQAGLALGRALEAEARQRAEQELRAHLRFIAEFTALVPGLVYVLDLVELRFVYLNREAQALIGDRGDTGGATALLEGLVHPDDAPALATHLRSLRHAGDRTRSRAEYRLRRPDGTYRWFASLETPLRRGDDGLVREVIGVATDVTDRRVTEGALRAAAERDRYRAALADALRAAEDAAAAQGAAAWLLGTHIRATRVHYADVVDGGAVGVVHDDYCDGVPSVVGRHRLDDHGPALMDRVRAGEVVRVDDVSADPRITDDERIRTAGLGIGASVIVPLLRGGRLVGLLVAHQSTRRVWSDADVAIIEETAARTFDAVERAQAAAALGESEQRYRSLFGSIDEGFCLIEIVTDDSGEPVDYRFLEVNRRFEEQTGLVDPVGRTARELVPDLEDHWIATYARAGLGGETVRFQSESEAMGRWFDVYASPVEPVGSGRAVVVFNDVTVRRQAEDAVRRNEEAERRARLRAELIASVASRLDPAEDVEALAQRFVEVLVPGMADFAVVEVPARRPPVVALTHADPARRQALRSLRERHRPATDGRWPAERAASGGPELVEDIARLLLARSPDDDDLRSLLDRLDPGAGIAVPLDVAGERGVLLLGVGPGRRAYTRDDLATASELAERGSLAFARARVRQEEHGIVLRLQEALLPERLARHPAVQAEATYRTSSDLLVGGDWYDAFPLPGGRLGFAVGDVVGHGLDAAASMGRVRVALAALAAEGDDPGGVLGRLDEFASGEGGVKFATACYAVLDPATGDLAYVSAAHPPLLVVSPDGEARWLQGGRGMPLGIGAGPRPPHATERLRDGDLLVLYSDGLVERRREPIDVGLERLARAAVAARHAPVGEACAVLVEELTGESPSDDDIVVMCVRFSPVTPSTFRRVMPARPEELAATRAAVRDWLASRGAGPATRDELLLVLGEALANAVEHAYVDGQGMIDITVTADESGDLGISVRDDGRWRAPGHRGADMGRGTGIMSAITRRFARESGDTGTTVTFVLPHGGD